MTFLRRHETRSSSADHEIQAFFEDIHGAIVQTHGALTRGPADPGQWVLEVADAFKALEAKLDSADPGILFPDMNSLHGSARVLAMHYSDAHFAFRGAARLWFEGAFDEAGDEFTRGKTSWNAMNDLVDRLAGNG